MSEERPLDSVVSVLIDHRGKTAKKLGGDFTDSGVRVVSAIHIKNGRINWEERDRYVTPEMYERWMPEKLRRGDVLLTSEAPLGEVAQVPDDEPLVLSQRLFALRGRPGVMDSGYLRYFLQSQLGQQRLRANQSGSTVAGIQQARLRTILVRVPPLPEQERIAGVLGSVDDLIETNRRLIADLEGLLFARCWELAQDAPTIRFDELATRVVDRAKPGEWQPGTIYLGLEHFGTDGIGLTGIGSADGIQSSSLRFQPGDVLYGKLRPYFRKVARPGFHGLCSAEIWALRANPGHSQAVLHAVAHSPQFSEVAMAGNSGTKMPRADWDHIAKMRVPDLRGLLTSEGGTALDALWSSAAQLHTEIADLIRQRDELLPLLMSGRVKVEPEGTLVS